MNVCIRSMISSCVFAALLLVLFSCSVNANDRRAEIESRCSERSLAFGSTEQLFCLQYWGAREGVLASGYAPTLCFACTLICDEEQEDYAACRERCSRACGLSGEATAVAGK
ncbi:hypothetical protein dsx2_3016 [Desulfovibrio sp. X2]|uniref:hypothetical protein n=1 Tax=Desulfovibrio sp. X2 TaxID=941449 RepID=UPI0003587FE8|nr:hypothetical protein [Desulfovibrio sp. X2]EPR41666.1 hypothetical protein dsx2_3016 [Desulfovibrio sp. X2]